LVRHAHRPAASVEDSISDEPVRRFMARLRGLANICNLTTKYPSNTCAETVSHVNTTILLALVKGLVDDDTKGEILSRTHI
jgi:hypothetical protein